MKKIILIPLTITVAILSTFIIIDFQSKGGSATSKCSSLFVTCNTTCKETHIYSTSNCEGSLFPVCNCDGLMKKEKKSIRADSIQLKNIDRFIDYVSELEITHKDDLLTTLNEIKNAIEVENYKGYKSGVDKYFDITSEFSKKHKKPINNWIKKYATQQRYSLWRMKW